jgi:hypothetical protein
MEPPLKASGTQCLKLKCDELRSFFAFNFNLRRYSLGFQRVTVPRGSPVYTQGEDSDSVYLVHKGQGLRPTRFNLEIRSTRPIEFGRFLTSRIGSWVILPMRHGALRVQGCI